MSFYICVKGNLTAHEFDYLRPIDALRLDPTLVPGDSQAQKQVDKNPKAWAVEVMTKGPESLSPNDKVEKAVALMKSKQIHHIPLISKGILVGMVSDRDIMWLTKFDLDATANLKSYMSKMVLVIDEETPIEHAAQAMVKEKISALPVIDSKHHLTGILTHNDILKFVFD